jgi:hypothetical protein
MKRWCVYTFKEEILMKYLVFLITLALPTFPLADTDNDELYKQFLEMCALTALVNSNLANARDHGVPLIRQLEEIEKARVSNDRSSLNNILFDSMKDAAPVVMSNPKLKSSEIYSRIFDNCVNRMNNVRRAHVKRNAFD